MPNPENSFLHTAAAIAASGCSAGEMDTLTDGKLGTARKAGVVEAVGAGGGPAWRRSA